MAVRLRLREHNDSGDAIFDCGKDKFLRVQQDSEQNGGFDGQAIWDAASYRKR